MKKMLPQWIQFSICLLLSVVACTTARAQTTAFWTNSLGGEWNTAGNWDINLVPSEGTNADIGTFATTTVNYDLPMAATSFGVLSVGASSVLNINTNGFNLDGAAGINALMTIAGTVNVNPDGNVIATNGAGISIATPGLLN